MSSRQPNRDSLSTTFRVPPPRVSEDIARGIYANNIQSLGTANEAVLDFSAIMPKNFTIQPDGRPSDVKLDHVVVARILLPNHVLDNWISQLLERRFQRIAGHPQALPADADWATIVEIVKQGILRPDEDEGER